MQPDYRAELAEQDAALSKALSLAITYERDHKFSVAQSLYASANPVYASDEYWIWTGVDPSERQRLGWRHGTGLEPHYTFERVAWDMGRLIALRPSVWRAISNFCFRKEDCSDKNLMRSTC